MLLLWIGSLILALLPLTVFGKWRAYLWFLLSLKRCWKGDKTNIFSRIICYRYLLPSPIIIWFPDCISFDCRKKLKEKYAFQTATTFFSVFILNYLRRYLIVISVVSCFFRSLFSHPLWILIVYSIRTHRTWDVLINKLYCSCLKTINLNRILWRSMCAHTHIKYNDAPAFRINKDQSLF